MTDVLEYRTIDKSAWGPGPWQDEPDKMQWVDEATGYPCLLKRQARLGHLCGYVGIPPGHPFYGHGWTEIGHGDPSHGGITYAAHCENGGPEATSICHIPAPGEPDDVWWLGFDCGHGWDLQPGMEALNARRFAETGDPIWSSFPGDQTYKTVGYVQENAAELAAWLKECA